MVFMGKTIFDKACGAGSKFDFSDFNSNAQNKPNKPLFFQGSKNNPQAEFCQPWTSGVRLNAFCPPNFY